jgi:ADP-ribose pyrophosphatase
VVQRRYRVLRSRTIFEGRVVCLKVDRVVEPGGITVNREVVYHPGSVVVLPELPDGRLLLVRQFRYAARRWLWELVAGGIEPGETPLEAAKRELVEETGYQARTFRQLLTFFPTPGFVSEKMHLLEARGLTRAKARPEADERIRLGRFTDSQLRRMLRSKKIEDGKTLVGLLWRFSREKRVI